MVSRTITALALGAPAALAAIDTARAQARARVVGRRGWARPRPRRLGHSPAPFKRGFGFHPLCVFVDHGPAGTGEMVAVQLRPGNAGSNTATDHIAVTRAALAQLPGHQPGRRTGRKVLIRTDGAGSSHRFLQWLTAQRLSYSVGFALPTTPRPC